MKLHELKYNDGARRNRNRVDARRPCDPACAA